MLSVSHRTLAMVHNGQIVNATRLRNALEDAGSIFRNHDSEIIRISSSVRRGLLEKIRRRRCSWKGHLPSDHEREHIYAVRDRIPASARMRRCRTVIASARNVYL
ncbi:MAG: hypothetical protein ACLVJ6_00480 [Merdibacter sp.]